MLSGATNLHLLHRASKERSDLHSDERDQNAAEDEIRRQEPLSPSEGPEYQTLSQLLPPGLEIERSPSETEIVDRQEEEEDDEGAEEGKYSKLSFFFLLLVTSGVGNILAAKMQAISMHNYPAFLSLFSYTIYVPICFCFILPVSRFGWLRGAIPEHHMTLPKRPFAVMGFLDCLAAVMQCFASICLPGSLLVLLPQASIPLSMLLSKHMLGERFRSPQYLGAAIVFAGLLLVLEPVVTYRHAPDYLCEAIDLKNHCTICSSAKTEEACLQLDASIPQFWALSLGQNGSLALLLPRTMHQSAQRRLHTIFGGTGDFADDAICEWVPLSEASNRDKEWSVFVWSIVMVLSCIPMTLSSIYKQIKLRAHGDLHPIFLIGWIGVYQFLFSLVSAPSLGWITGIPLRELPENLWDGLKCYFGMKSIETGCHPDFPCSSGHAFLYVNVCLLFQGLYLLSTMLVLKHGSTSLLYLALTMVVPLAHLTFSLPFIREDTSIYISDVIALLVIVLGLFLYRFGHKLPKRRSSRPESGDLPLEEQEEQAQSEPCHPLLEPLISYAYV